jgi:lipopolysaccharide transport system permease protein
LILEPISMKQETSPVIPEALSPPGGAPAGGGGAPQPVVQSRTEENDEEVKVIRAHRIWEDLNPLQVWNYREFMKVLVIRELKSRYRQMALGPLWILLQPLVQTVVYSFVLGSLANLPSDGVPYPAFTYTALLGWVFFSRAVVEGTNSLVGNMGLMTRIYFPRMIIPVSVVLSCLIDFVMSFVVVLGLVLYYGIVPSWWTLTVPLFLLYAIIVAVSVSLWCSALQVRFRDTKIMVGFLIQFWLYGTPVAYSASLVPDWILPYYQLNPMYWVTQGFRFALLGTSFDVTPALYLSLMVTFLLLLSGGYVFHRAERSVIDLL